MPSAAAPNARTTASAMAYHQPASIPGRLGSRPGRACPVAPLVGKGSDPPAADLTTKKGSIREGWCVNDIVLTAVKMIYLKHQRVPPSRHTPSTNLEHGPDAPHSARSRNVFLGRRSAPHTRASHAVRPAPRDDVSMSALGVREIRYGFEQSAGRPVHAPSLYSECACWVALVGALGISS